MNKQSPKSNDLPLAGIRVLDLTVVWAGPYATMQLADWGAEVIRIETRYHFAATTRGMIAHPPRDSAMVRQNGGMGYPDDDPGDRPWNRSAVFNAHGRNKLAMTVDMTRPEGREVFEALIRVSDGLIENNAPTNMERLGITWERLSAINPRFILVRQPAFGLDGPYKNYRTWGNHMEALSGHPLIRAYPDEDPSRGASGVPADAAGGIGGAMAFMMGLRQRERTGKGMQIEIPSAENFVPFLGDFIMDYTMNGRVHTQLGNEDLAMAPHQAYRCQGDERWIAIACRDDADWRGLCGVMGAPNLAEDPRFRNSLDRWEHRRELDVIISQWTATEDAGDLMRRLQAAGVPAGQVLDERDAFQDTHHRARGFWQSLEHPEIDGPREHAGLFFQLSDIPNRLRRAAPRLGEDNEYVYKKVLGFSDEKYREFEAVGHIGMDYDPSVP
ncbi:MAG: CoA transferase [Chloroflexi bacterium]|nr:CoA transferase [Chloroflexota bacterium]